MTIAFDNSYARLPARFYAHVSPSRVRAPKLVKLNHGLARELGLDLGELDSPIGAELFSGNRVPEGATPIALAYAGHQFGGFVPQLGDGRAILLGEVRSADGARWDIQLKGSGRTPFSRGGDGRAALGPVLREYIVSEAMAALGVPTTRALAAVTTGEWVLRDESLPGAVLTRVAASHLRVGTFEFFAARDDREALSILERVRNRSSLPTRIGAEPNEPLALTLLDCVIEAQAALVAKWLGVGFIHGVMNTDNTSISGITIDYGPCAFLDDYDPAKKFSAIDAGGRYAFGKQPRIAHWNMARFAETLLPLFSSDEAEAARLAMTRLDRFSEQFEARYLCVMREKLGLTQENAADGGLIDGLLQRLAANGVDYTVFFRALCAAAEDPLADRELAALFPDPPAYHGWAESWRRRAEEERSTPAERASAMRRVNPAIIPRNHRVEQAISAARSGDYSPFERLVRALSNPYDDQPEFRDLSEPPKQDELVRQTFCGT